MKKIFFFFLLGIQMTQSQDAFIVPDSILMGRYRLQKNELDYALQPQAARAFQMMKAAALKDSIKLKVVSSFRDYSTQKSIWNRKYKRFTLEGLSPLEAIERIVEYSTLPGTSRHHWGTEVDLILGDVEVIGDVLLAENFHGGPYEKLRLWLEKNAADFDFHIVYTADSLRKGFLYEPWHYSYAPLSIPYLKQYKENRLILKMSQDTTLLGHQYLSSKFIEEYYNANVLEINPILK